MALNLVIADDGDSLKQDPKQLLDEDESSMDARKRRWDGSLYQEGQHIAWFNLCGILGKQISRSTFGHDEKDHFRPRMPQ